MTFPNGNSDEKKGSDPFSQMTFPNGNSDEKKGSDPFSDPAAIQDEIVSSFSYFSEWLDRYQYLIDLGRKLPPLAEAEKTDDRLLAGCQSRVWLHLEGDADEVIIRANSDAAIVSGLIALLVQVYSGCSARQIADTEPYFIREIGLSDHLSPTRANGLHAMLAAIKGHAQALLFPEPGSDHFF